MKSCPGPNFQAKVIEVLTQLPQPVISAVHGHCYTGALELAGWGPDFGQCEREVCRHPRQVGIATCVGNQPAPAHKMSNARPPEMMLTARIYAAAQALDMGLVVQVFDDDAFEAEVVAYCREMLQNSLALLARVQGLTERYRWYEPDRGLGL